MVHTDVNNNSMKKQHLNVFNRTTIIFGILLLLSIKLYFDTGIDRQFQDILFNMHKITRCFNSDKELIMTHTEV